MNKPADRRKIQRSVGSFVHRFTASDRIGGPSPPYLLTIQEDEARQVLTALERMTTWLEGMVLGAE